MGVGAVEDYFEGVLVLRIRLMLCFLWIISVTSSRYSHCMPYSSYAFVMTYNEDA